MGLCVTTNVSILPNINRHLISVQMTIIVRLRCWEYLSEDLLNTIFNGKFHHYLLCTMDKRFKTQFDFCDLRFDIFDESSGIVLHCCDNLCEYNFIRSFNSCGSKLCESMAATSMILLCACACLCIQNEWEETYKEKYDKIIDFTVENAAHISYLNRIIYLFWLTLQNLELFD